MSLIINKNSGGFFNKYQKLDGLLIHQKTSEKPLALDMGRKAAALKTEMNLLS